MKLKTKVKKNWRKWFMIAMSVLLIVTGILPFAAGMF